MTNIMEMPVFNATPIADLQATHGKFVHTFNTRKTRPLEYRLTQLRKLWWAIKDGEDLLIEAMRRDLGKPEFECRMAETGWCMNDIAYVCEHLAHWAKDEKAADITLLHLSQSPKIRKDPLGAVVILGAYNFPVQLSVGPFIGAIAAGCTAVLKPSEGSPYTAAVLAELINNTLDPDSYRVVLGAVPESTALLDLKWDKIFYTGGPAVGKIIAKKAAETLTPVTLELGGRNPAFVTASADPRIAARRLLWAKTMNAGAVCISQNYILVDRGMLPALVEEFKKAIKEFYPNGVANSAHYGRVVNAKQLAKLKGMLDGSKGKVLVGGAFDEKDRFLEPTLVEVTDVNDSLLVEESFGPLIPILAVDDLEEAIRIANEIDPTPLGCYPFGSKADTSRILDATRSGGASVNDGFYHGCIPTLEFGGVGSSGQGSYRGKASFDTFTHRRAVTSTPTWVESMMAVRYPPFTKGKLAQWRFLNDYKPNFSRDGKVNSRGIIGLILTLGGAGAMSGLARWAVVVAAAYALYVNRQR